MKSSCREGEQGEPGWCPHPSAMTMARLLLHPRAGAARCPGTAGARAAPYLWLRFPELNSTKRDNQN